MAKYQQSTLYSSALILLISFYFSGCVSNPLPNRFEDNGFIYIGNISSDQAGNSTRVVKAGTKALSLYLSGPNDRKENQIAAAEECNSLDGKLLFILNQIQFDEVKLATHGLGESFWTSGIYDGNAQRFVWLVNNREVNTNFIRKETRCSEANAQIGLTVQGSLSLYGLCGARIGSALRYICRL